VVAARVGVFSIVIPMYNSEKTIAVCLNSILKGSFKEFEIIVADDGSKDRSPSIVREFAKQHQNIHLIQIDHKGPSKARNEGAKRARGDILVFVDSDCIVGRDWLSNIKKGFEKHKVVAVASQYSNAQSPAFISKFALYELQFRERNIGRYTTSASSCNFAVRRKVFESLGGFPEEFMAGEDIHFSNGVSRYGKILWDRGNGVSHCFKTSLRGYLRQQFAYAKNSLRVFMRFPHLAFVKTIQDKGNYIEIMLTGLLPLMLLLSFFINRLWWVLCGIIVGLLLINAPFLYFLQKREDWGFAAKAIPVIFIRNIYWLLGAVRGLL